MGLSDKRWGNGGCRITMTKRLEKYLKEHLQLIQNFVSDEQVNLWVKDNILPTSYDKYDEEEVKEQYRVYKDLLRFLGGRNDDEV